MAPKRAGIATGATVTKRKRTVRRPARQPSSSSDSTASASIPIAAAGPSSPPVDSLAGRVITMGRKVDFGFLDDEGFELGNQLRRMGWETVCSLELPTYPALVKEFYGNLARGDGGLVSMVRGTRILVTYEILGSILSCPVSGMTANASSDRGGALSRFLGRHVSNIEEVQANQLPLELRLLHNICSRLLFPKTGRFEYVSERDVVVMDSVISGTPLNLPGMIVWYMAEARDKKRMTLPYGMILTKIFQEQGVSITSEEPMKKLRHTDFYRKATLHRMGFKKVNGIWTRRNKEGGSAGMEAGDHSSSEDEPSARQAQHDSSHPTAPTPAPVQSPAKFTEAQLDQISSLLAAQKSELKEELNSSLLNLNESFYSLDVKVTKFQSDFESSMVDLKNDMYSKFDEMKEVRSLDEVKEKINNASTLLEKKIDDCLKSQNEEIKKILEELKKKDDV